MALFDSGRKERGPDESDGAGHHEGQRWGDRPECPPERSGGRDGETANEVIEPDATGADLGSNEIDDKRLAGRLPEFAQTADHEARNECAERMCRHDGDREEG